MIFNIDTDINPALVLLDQFDSLRSGNTTEAVMSAIQGVCGDALTPGKRLSPSQIYITSFLDEWNCRYPYAVYIGANLVKQFDRNNAQYWDESRYYSRIMAFPINTKGKPCIIVLETRMMPKNGKNNRAGIYMIPPKYKWVFFLGAIDRYYKRI